MSHIEFEGDDVPIFDMNGARLSLSVLVHIAEVIEENGGLIIQRCNKKQASKVRAMIEDYASAYALLQQTFGTGAIPNGGSFKEAIALVLGHLDRSRQRNVCGAQA